MLIAIAGCRVIRGTVSSTDKDLVEHREQMSKLQDTLITHGVLETQRNVHLILGKTERMGKFITQREAVEFA